VRLSLSATALRRAFVLASVLWAVLLPVAAYAASRSPGSSLVYGSVAVVYAIGSIVCHQLPARSIHLWGAQMPVCARCTGLYAGAALFAVQAAVRATATDGPTARLKRHDSMYTRKLLVLAALPTIASLVYEWTTGQIPSNTIRALAGVTLGAAVAAVVLSAAENQVN